MANDTAEQQSQEIVLDPTSDAVVVRGGVRVQFNANGGIDVYGKVPVTLHPAAVPAANTGPQVGDKQADGTVFAGISPDTGKAMYARPSDEPYTMKWQRAMDYAARYEGHGHPAGTFRVPTMGELNVLFKNRAAIGGFDLSGSNRADWYWSATEHRGVAGNACGQLFGDGFQGWNNENLESSIRLVRS